jgi:methylmalonyl-CoA mutase
MNAAIDQECEKYIQQNNLVDEVNKKIDAIYKSKNAKRPSYNGVLPEGNDGLGLIVIRCYRRSGFGKRSV